MKLNWLDYKKIILINYSPFLQLIGCLHDKPTQDLQKECLCIKDEKLILAG
jgi:hypothetical protein